MWPWWSARWRCLSGLSGWCSVTDVRPGWSPEAPLPADPTRCRWCGGRLVRILPHRPQDYCQAGCLPNDRASYTGHCQDCGNQFHTGKSLILAIWCHPCERKREAERAEPDGPDRYQFSKYGRGRWR